MNNTNESPPTLLAKVGLTRFGSLSYGGQARLSVFVVRNFTRAHGGCLDTKRRRRTWQGAKCLGELPSKL